MHTPTPEGYWPSKVEFRELKTHDTLEEIIDFTTSPLIIERVVNFEQTASEGFLTGTQRGSLL